jgi:hypothetical protein
MSNFETAALDAGQKADVGPLFPRAGFKTTVFETGSNIYHFLHNDKKHKENEYEIAGNRSDFCGPYGGLGFGAGLGRVSRFG